MKLYLLSHWIDAHDRDQAAVSDPGSYVRTDDHTVRRGALAKRDMPYLPGRRSMQPSSPYTWSVHHTHPSGAGVTSWGCDPLGTGISLDSL
jgi:hypothetical protein